MPLITAILYLSFCIVLNQDLRLFMGISTNVPKGQRATFSVPPFPIAQERGPTTSKAYVPFLGSFALTREGDLVSPLPKDPLCLTYPILSK